MEFTGTSGIHHITAIASDAQRTLDFYAGVLGMRLVKKTVNFDAPETYHFYLGDTRGHPGTLMTFFIWPRPTADLLAKDLGLRRIQAEEGVERYATPGKGPGRFVDIRSAPGSPPGVIGCGSVHHMAFRAADDTWQMTVRNRLVERGFKTTPQIDRKYFKSIYFHEPGGVLLEVATDTPGFTVDERIEKLGSGLMLPEKYEPYRERLEQVLSPVHPPEAPR